MRKILILANHYNTLRIFRRELIKELVKYGNLVTVSIPATDAENVKTLESYGCRVVITKFERKGMNPVSDLLLIIRYINLLREIKPDKVITYTIKPNIYGSIACKLQKIKHYVNVTGLGSAFQSEGLTKNLVTFLYKNAINKAEKVFFENIGNRDSFVGSNILPKNKTVVMPGAGVNLIEFKFCDYPPTSIIRFLFIGRIMKEKGIDELFSAIKKIKKKYSNVEFVFIGWYEENYERVIAEMEQKKIITYYGFQPDVKPFIKNAHCVILPSHHEGMSNTLLESAAMGRPLITSNIHGCLEAVLDGKSGMLCNVKDSEDLCIKIQRFIELPFEAKAKMGQLSRTHIEDIFDKRKVVAYTLRELGVDCIS